MQDRAVWDQSPVFYPPVRGATGRGNRRVLVAVSSRADRTPLSPVIKLLPERYVLDLEGLSHDGCVAGTFNWIREYQPDVLLVLGDRSEILASCVAATVAKVPIAHIHGGECSFGSYDDQIRHAITKLSCVHFAATYDYASRIRRLGERNVHVTGAPGLDNLRDMPPRKKGKSFVLAFHPATTHDEDPHKVVDALEKFPDYEVIWVGVNSDPGSNAIREAFPWSETPLTSKEYVSVCRNATAVIGNSSSGLIEAPVMEVPTVNIGERQKGRARGVSVIDVGMDDIESGIKRAIGYTGTYHSPYGGFGASQKIVTILMETELRLSKPWLI